MVRWGKCTANPTLYDASLQQLYDQTDLDFKVEVINTGWPGWNSKTETNTIQTRLLGFDPDLFIVYDGWNDMRKERKNESGYSATEWKERWMEICVMGKQYDFDTIITLQPLVGTGEKILTAQEYEYKIKTLNILLNRITGLVQEVYQH